MSHKKIAQIFCRILCSSDLLSYSKMSPSETIKYPKPEKGVLQIVVAYSVSFKFILKENLINSLSICSLYAFWQKIKMGKKMGILSFLVDINSTVIQNSISVALSRFMERKTKIHVGFHHVNKLWWPTKEIQISNLITMRHTPLLNGPISSGTDQRSGILHIVRDP